MGWTEEIKKTPLSQLEVYSRTGEIVGAQTQGRDNFAGAQSQIFVKEDDDSEFAIKAAATAIGRPGHRLTVIFLKRSGSNRGGDIAYYNHALRSLTYDAIISGTADGSEMELPLLVHGWNFFARVLVAVIVAAIVTNPIATFLGLPFGTSWAVVLVVVAIPVFLVVRWFDTGGQRRLSRIRALVESEVARVKA